MTKSTDAFAQTQQNRKKNRPALIAVVAFAAALGVVALPLLTPQADAALSNGGFCIGSTYDSHPEIKGVAGGEHCGAPSTTPTAEPELMTKYYSEAIQIFIWSADFLKRDTRVSITRIIDGKRTVVYDQGSTVINEPGIRMDYHFDDWTSFEQPTPVSQYAPTYEIVVAVPGVGTFTKTVDLHTVSSSTASVERYIALRLDGPDLWVDTSKG
ncbi:hypothetical protein [Microbacterium lacticum]|uniref:Uncharacterized protein n=1 Tax=Microbacterium lacticum TaxID=33885 RepID=A0A4Y3USG6_9MICO|nr:hypothetical protein [Microbacterium lacticum]TQM98798.1 hypothetical protein FHX68_1510 [Microbacterium lacticum]GEB96448.1 hypothetical protein MLA01_26670 [Microbacterium lacticum]GGI74624.1 hypothetical protein GCM10009724_27010 [Microbacterium lacticum]